MTYILVGKFDNEEANSLDRLGSLISKLFSREFNLSEIDGNPDIHILEQGKKDSIGIEEVKDFQKEMQFKPFQEKVQVGIIFNSEKLTSQSQNALLKTLEESADTSVYVLLVNNERNLLSTIRSRARVLYADSSQRAEQTEIFNLEERDLAENFELANEFSESKESSVDFLNRVEEGLKVKLEIEIKNGNIGRARDMLGRLKIIADGREKVMANCNRKLVLESIIVQLQG